MQITPLSVPLSVTSSKLNNPLTEISGLFVCPAWTFLKNTSFLFYSELLIGIW